MMRRNVFFSQQSRSLTTTNLSRGEELERQYFSNEILDETFFMKRGNSGGVSFVRGG